MTPVAEKKSHVQEVRSQLIPLDAPEILEKALAELENKLGGRDALANSLQLVPGLTQEETTLVFLLANPENRKKSLAYLAGSVGTTVGKVLELFTKGEASAAYVQAMRKFYRQLPAISEDVAARALPNWRTCGVCRGKGVLRNRYKILDEDGEPVSPIKWKWETERCLTCEGQGQVEQVPDLERQKLALEAGGIIKGKGGIIIDQSQQTLNAGSITMIKSSPDFRTATDRLLYPGKSKPSLVESTVPEPIEAEVVEQEPELVQPENHPEQDK